MGDVLRNVVTPMIATYGELETDDQDLVVAAYERLLAVYSDNTLTKAWDLVAADYLPSKRMPWPAPALIKRACEKVAVVERASKRLPELSRDTKNAALAMQAVRSEMGKQAAREGWVLGLHDFVVKHGREPRPFEVGELIKAAKYVDRCAAGVEKMGALHAPLAKLAESILARRERLARTALGEAAT